MSEDTSCTVERNGSYESEEDYNNSSEDTDDDQLPSTLFPKISSNSRVAVLPKSGKHLLLYITCTDYLSH